MDVGNSLAGAVQVRAYSPEPRHRRRPRLDFPPPPATPPPELYSLSDEYSSERDGFWNSPVNAPWECRVTDLDAPQTEELLINQLAAEEPYRRAGAEMWPSPIKVEEHHYQPEPYRSQVWVDGSTPHHVSSVVITHGADDLVDGFVETKPLSRMNSPDMYSYAYYEKARYECDRQARHTYTTRYGTEENIYEEISDVGTGLRRRRVPSQQTLVEEEVREVQSNHRRVLGQLNLAMEAMLMPGEAREEQVLQVQVPDIDSGFSGSSGGSAYGIRGKPLSNCNEYYLPPRPSSGNLTNGRGKSGRTSWAKRGWRKIAHLAANKVNVLDEPHGKQGWETQPHGHGRASSEDSWCSGSDNELSSGDESSERSATSSTRSSGQLRQTLQKARTLCDKLRHDPAQPQGRLSRWFSMRRGATNQYEVDALPDRRMPLLSEVEEEGNQSTCLKASFTRRTAPPRMPPPPANLTPEKIKRRHIVSAIVQNENSYVTTLQRLVNEYKKPLEESSPAILNGSKVAQIFHKLPEILQCHTLFRIALAEAVRTWDRDERIGDVFVASFSKSVVLDVYSEFINNFSAAMDLAKSEQKRKQALLEFLQVKQISSPDRLSLFALMVKPVQRFPQFILLLQDLLKHTPQGHQDRMSLQLALTQLESLAEMLNERKREAEQLQAFREMLRRVSGKLIARPLSDSNRCLLREDRVTQLEFNACGSVSKRKPRRLLLLNDLLLCVAADPASTDRLSLKWSHPVTEIEVLDTSASPTLSRVLTAAHRVAPSRGDGDGSDICQEMGDLMHDYEVLSRITELVGTLRASYQDLNIERMRGLQEEVKLAMKQKDEAMSWLDACCLQFTLKNKGGKEEVLTFQTDNPAVKKEWTTELRLAQLALDPNNSPAWEVPEQEQRPTTKMPLFVKTQCVYSSPLPTEVHCGCFYTAPRRARAQGVLWVCSGTTNSSHVTVLGQSSHQASSLRPLFTFDLPGVDVTCMEYVRGDGGDGLASDLVWMGTSEARILIYSAVELEKGHAVMEVKVSSAVTGIRYHGDQVFVALDNGCISCFARREDGTWDINEPTSLHLGSSSISCLLPINLSLYAACDNKVFVICVQTTEIQKSFTVQHGSVKLMAHSGVGLWISLNNSSTICLYHTETFKHLQDINIASNVLRVTTPPSTQCSNHDCPGSKRAVVGVTALLACKGLLWVGTSAGICVTIPLPRLEGVPIISGRVNISYHAHFGPIGFLLPLHNPVRHTPAHIKKSSGERSVAERVRQQLAGSPVVLRRRTVVPDSSRRGSKTLPRSLGYSSSSSQGSGDCDVYGLYGDLLNCRETGDETNGYETLRRSDPDLTAQLGTLDRRLRSRPRSLDMSSWSVASHASSLYTSSSEESVPKPREMKRSESAGALPSLVAESPVKEQKEPEVALERKTTKKVVGSDRRTVITVMGGRGYVNWRAACCPDRLNKAKEPNRADAHLVVWEMKL